MFVMRNLVLPFASSGLRRGQYIDIGAGHPIENSTSAFFDFCLGWRGVCVEPDPAHAAALVKERSCEVLSSPVCAPGDPVYSCLSFESVFAATGSAGATVDLVVVRVGRDELDLFQGFPFDGATARVVVVNVGKGVRWLEFDSLLLPAGYLKVAVVGSDAVFVHRSAFTQMAGNIPDWPWLRDGVALPAQWDEFHSRVIAEERDNEKTAAE